jgi:hypothetical protein
VSDIHGFVGQLTNPESMSEILPEGDILLHLGDFAVEELFENMFNGLGAFNVAHKAVTQVQDNFLR